jgi:hypothetical protein
MSRGSEELEAAGMSRAVAEAMAVPEFRERTGLTNGGGADRISQGFLHVVHPDTGNEVVFVPGEALPDWAVTVQKERLAELLRPAPVKAEPKGNRPIQNSVKESEGK